VKFSGWYGIVVGLMMVMMWVFFLASGQVPELETEPLSIYFHLVAEFATAVLLFVAGIGLLKNCQRAKKTFLVAAGMLVYTVINSPGYYAQRSEWAFVVMFGIILIVAIASIFSVAKHLKN